MASSFNKVILMGRLCSHPELKQTPSGASVTSFQVAVDRRFTKEGQEKQTDFITLVAWRQTAEFICRYFEKGSAILVCGELQTRTWTDANNQKRYATEVMVTEVSFCGSKADSSATSAAPAPTYSAPTYSQNQMDFSAPRMESVEQDDDLPF